MNIIEFNELVHQLEDELDKTQMEQADVDVFVDRVKTGELAGDIDIATRRDAVAEIFHLKAEHLISNWQDKDAAKFWGKQNQRLNVRFRITEVEND